jgi:hypothetical protein
MSKKDEAAREWRRRHKEELYALYSSPNIIRVIKSRIMKWVWHVVLWRQERYIQGFGGET